MQVSSHPLCRAHSTSRWRCRGSDTLCSLVRPPGHGRVLLQPCVQHRRKGKLMCSCQGASAGFLSSIPAMLLLSQSSLALCFPGLFLPKERALGLQDPAAAPRDAGSEQSAFPCPVQGAVFIHSPRVSGAPQHPRPGWRVSGGALCTSLPTLGSVIPHHTLLH